MCVCIWFVNFLGFNEDIYFKEVYISFIEAVRTFSNSNMDKLKQIIFINLNNKNLILEQDRMAFQLLLPYLSFE